MPRFAGFFDARALAVDFRSIGFRECLTEVIRYLGVLEGPSSRADPVRIRLLSHLNSYTEAQFQALVELKEKEKIEAVSVDYPVQGR